MESPIPYTSNMAEKKNSCRLKHKELRFYMLTSHLNKNADMMYMLTSHLNKNADMRYMYN